MTTPEIIKALAERVAELERENAELAEQLRAVRLPVQPAGPTLPHPLFPPLNPPWQPTLGVPYRAAADQTDASRIERTTERGATYTVVGAADAAMRGLTPFAATLGGDVYLSGPSRIPASVR